MRLELPARPADAQLAQIGVLKGTFVAHPIGYSDHVMPSADGMPALDMAVLLGAVIIEKHFTDDKTAVGNDHYHAMDEKDLASFMRRLALLCDFYGSTERDLSGERLAIQNARRRIVAARDIAAGETLDEENLIPLRSNRGIEIAQWDVVVGRATSREISRGAPLEWTDLK
nr:N-acetylneuraminate synthase family protein [Methyloceanibacter superfactus]